MENIKGRKKIGNKNIVAIVIAQNKIFKMVNFYG
jgi:hypothetical protein